jgi:drug/metabolite transporter (DMT)-like permease
MTDGAKPAEQPEQASYPGRAPWHGVAFALASSILFGASTPLAKLLLGEVTPVLLAGLLYLGSGCGLTLWWLLRWRYQQAGPAEARLKRADLPWLVGAIAFGGMAGPVLLLVGLATTPASSASLLLNLEGVFTALLAWFVFKENFDLRIALGMAAITAGGILLSWAGRPALGVPWGPLAVAGACLAWGIDNNLTRKIAAGDPVQIATAKGLVAGTVNLTIALAAGATLPDALTVLAAAGVGLLGYGVSLTLFVLALRHIGTARTGAYFSTAPFVGAVLAVVLLGERVTLPLLGAAVLMAIGLWLHLTERHEHEHDHAPLSHEHRHTHDEHHQHAHGPSDPAGEPHSHMHYHAPLRHSHPHYPDIHHRHKH